MRVSIIIFVFLNSCTSIPPQPDRLKLHAVVIDKHLTISVPESAKEIPTHAIDSLAKRFEQPDRKIVISFGPFSGNDFGTIDDVEHFTLKYLFEGRGKVIHFFNPRVGNFPYISELIVPHIPVGEYKGNVPSSRNENSFSMLIECRTKNCQNQNDEIFRAVLLPADKPMEKVVLSDGATYFAVDPNPQTKVVTFHIQSENFLPPLQNELEQFLINFANKCWFWAAPSYQEALVANGPKYCLKFVKFTKIDLLKPYMREPTNIKILLKALGPEGRMRLQKFVWDGEQLQRVRNTDSKLQDKGTLQERLSTLIFKWAEK